MITANLFTLSLLDYACYPVIMLRLISTMVFQLIVFVCLLLFLTWGSVERMADGRIIATLCEHSDFISGQLDVQAGSNVFLYIVEPPVPDTEPAPFTAELIESKPIANGDATLWVMNNIPFAKDVFPKKYACASYYQLKVALMPEHLMQVQRAVKDKKHVILQNKRLVPMQLALILRFCS